VPPQRRPQAPLPAAAVAAAVIPFVRGGRHAGEVVVGGGGPLARPREERRGHGHAARHVGHVDPDPAIRRSGGRPDALRGGGGGGTDIGAGGGGG
jgi:hypothetical protein